MFDYTQVTAKGIALQTEEALSRADEIVASAIDSTTEPAYDRVMQPLDDAYDLVMRTYGQTAFMGYVHPDKEVRDAGNAAEERLQKWGVELIFRPELYQAVKSFSETAEAAGLQGEPRRFLEFWLRDLRKAGHELGEETRAEVKRHTERMVEVGIAFQRNIDEHRDHLLVSRADLEGMPDSYIENLEPGEEEGTYKIGLSYPDVVPFMENSPRRDLREQLARKFNTRAVEPNRPLLEEAIGTRARIAELFEEPSWAHHQLEEKMAKTPEAVRAFYAGLIPGLTEKGQAEIKVMEIMLGEDQEAGPLQAYD
ncbi:MAG: M3 family metallopeptidase, partial [Acidimicrobiia bacterium]